MRKPPHCPLSTSSITALCLFSFPIFPCFSHTFLPAPDLYQAGSSRAVPGISSGSVALAWEKNIVRTLELELGGCEGMATETSQPWKSLGM